MVALIRVPSFRLNFGISLLAQRLLTRRAYFCVARVTMCSKMRLSAKFTSTPKAPTATDELGDHQYPGSFWGGFGCTLRPAVTPASLRSAQGQGLELGRAERLNFAR